MSINNIEPMLNYSLTIPLLLIALIIVNIIIIIVSKTRKHNLPIKKQSLLQVKIVENKLQLSQISQKEATKQISIIVRNYIYNTSGIKINCYSLSEIKSLNNKTLSRLISECYKIEFSKKATINLDNIFKLAREIIKSWE